MAKTSSRIYGPAQVATGPTTIYTVPAVTKADLRYLHVSNPSGSPVTLTLSIGADAAATRIYGAYSVAANAVLQIPLYLTMAAAEILTASAGTNNILVLSVNADLTTL